MDERKRFDDLVTECTWTVMHGIGLGRELQASVRNVMQATIEWKNDLDAASPKPGLLDQMRRLNDVLNAERDKLTKENEQLKANLAEKSAEVMKFAGDVVKLEETVKNKDRAIEVLKETHGSLITEIAAQRDEAVRKSNQYGQERNSAITQRDWEKSERLRAEERLGEVASEIAEVKHKLDAAVKLKEQYRARLAVYVKAFGFLNTQLKTLGEPPEGE